MRRTRRTRGISCRVPRPRAISSRIARGRSPHSNVRRADRNHSRLESSLTHTPETWAVPRRRARFAGTCRACAVQHGAEMDRHLRGAQLASPTGDHGKQSPLRSHPELPIGLLQQLHGRLAELRDGEVADYIPELAKVDPNLFGICIATARRHTSTRSASRDVPFTIQSISKPFAYALALGDRGLAAVAARVDVEPSGEAFNEISLDPITERPRNPMINAGAITATSLVAGATPRSRFERIRSFYSRFAGRALTLDEDMYASEDAHRTPQPGDRLHAAQLRHSRRGPEDHGRRLLPAVLDRGRLPRSEPDGRDAGQRRRAPGDRASGCWTPRSPSGCSA